MVLLYPISVFILLIIGLMSIISQSSKTDESTDEFIGTGSLVQISSETREVSLPTKPFVQTDTAQKSGLDSSNGR